MRMPEAPDAASTDCLRLQTKAGRDSSARDDARSVEDFEKGRVIVVRAAEASSRKSSADR